MPEQPPAQLVAMLERLGLANAGQVARMGRRVKRLARDLPRFESVWVDALCQARILTPFQAAEINAGRGAAAAAGAVRAPRAAAAPVLRRLLSRTERRFARESNAGGGGRRRPASRGNLPSIGSARRVRETHREVSETTAPANCSRGDAVAAFLPAPSSLGLIAHVGVEAGRIFAAAPWVEGRTAAQWMVHHGRFPPEVVLEIARAMLASLIELHQAGICHGDVSTSSLILTDGGGVVLSLPGLRGILRPEEGYAQADLLPEAYDSLAPERISAGTPPDVRSDIYACGCVWWHLLCGRPPLAGGDSLAKLRAARGRRDLRRAALRPGRACSAGGGHLRLCGAGAEPEAGVAGPAGRHARSAHARRKRGVGRLSGPGRPAHRPLDDHGPLDPQVQPHAALDRRRSLFLGGGGGAALAELARTVNRQHPTPRDCGREGAGGRSIPGTAVPGR